MGDEETQKEISYTCEPGQGKVLNLLAYILNKFKVTFRPQNRFKLRHRPENGHPHILNNSKPFYLQGVMTGDVVEVIYCGELGASESPANEKTSIWDMFKKLSPRDFQKLPHIVGRGSAGVVYEAVTTNESLTGLSSLFALKELTLFNPNSPVTMKYVQNELRIMAACDHPAILPLVGVIPPSKENGLTIVTPFLNCSLQQWICQTGFRDLTPVERYIILYGIASGMQYLHMNRVHHRDLKPDNVLLNDERQPVIMDFGSSKISDSGSTMAQSIATGTYEYMAPEAYTETYGAKSDVYSYGILM